VSGLPDGVKYSPLPDIFVDHWLPHLRDTELVVMLYLVRRTWGHGLRNVEMSMTQICNGFSGQDKGTGLCRAAAHAAITRLVERGAVLERRGKSDNSPRRYAIDLKWNPLSVPPNDTYHQMIRITKQNASDGNATKNSERTTKQNVSPNRTPSVPPNDTPIPTVQTEEKTDSPQPSVDPQGGKPKREKREKPIGDHPESLEACITWFKEHGFPEAKAKEFWYHGELNGWTQGLAQKPIKKWTAAAHFWMRPKEWQQSGARASPSSTNPPRETVREIDNPDEFIKRKLGGQS